MRTAIVSAASPDYLALAEVTQPTRVRYAQKHGYDAFCFETTRERGDACKKDCYDALLGAGYDVMVWMDLDSQVQNSDIAIELLVAAHMQQAHFLWSYDHAGPNSGVYIVRFTSQGRHWMDRAYATMRENGLADETAMEILATTEPFKGWVNVVPGTVLNCYDPVMYGTDTYTHEINQYAPGRFIIHFPGIPNDERIPLLRKYQESAT